jgi:general nucleoside transport system ATP-binding protein
MNSTNDEIYLSSITKRFGEVLANDGVDLTLRRGEIHALLGENGAGKSTLMSILSGVYMPDRGEIIIEGEKARFRSPWDAVRRGIGMVHQHFQLVDAFSVLDNILLAATETSLRLNRRDAAARIEAVGRAHGLHINPNTLIWQLTVGQRQKVEILKLLYRGANLLLLDEPTSMLTPSEADDLYIALRRLAQSGKYVVFITHKLREVAATADRVTVLRHGRVIASVRQSEASISELGALMVGTAMPALRQLSPPRNEPVVLRLQDAQEPAHFDASGLQGVTLELRRGEILGIAGVAGNGQVELAECIAGIRSLGSGQVWLEGTDVTKADALSRMRRGLRFVPEDRLGMGLVPQLNIIDNIMLRDYRDGSLAVGALVNRREARTRAEAVVRDFDVRAPGVETAVRSLSGGNQQKILIGRELLSHPAVLVVAQPTRGLDIAAARAVHDRILDLREAGVGIILISEDLDEILQLSDRVAVLYGGMIRKTWVRAQANRGDIGAAMGGHLLDAEAA